MIITKQFYSLGGRLCQTKVKVLVSLIYTSQIFKDFLFYNKGNKMASKFQYKCNECGEFFHAKFDFLEHKNIHSNETPFMCVNCRSCFRLVKEYVDHINIKHKLLEVCDDLKENGRSICMSSSESFENYQDLKSQFCSKKFESEMESTENLKKCQCCSCKLNHKEIITNSIKKDTETFNCANCNKNFSSNLILAEHSCFVSSSEEIFKCSCSLTFINGSDFKSHIGKKPYSCCSCSMKFNTITNLIRHIRTHTKQKPYICKDCGRGFSQSANLRNHLSIHLGIRAVKCNECNFSCKTLNGLIKHKKKHNEGLNQQNYIDGRKKSTNKSTCPVCNKQFMFKRNMGMHMKVHNNRISLCNECGKVFNSKSKLTSHYKACHREPSVCKTCGKVFASAVLLNAHEKIHVSEKLFSCNFCQKTFSVKNYLVQHVKTHSNKKQFSCSKCGKLFKVAVSLKYHSNICTSLNIPV